MQIKEPKNKIYTNLELEDLPNEKWVDAFGYDGIYEVSTLGRIKSLQREANTRWGTPRIVKEKILKQSIRKTKKGRIDGLGITFDKTYSSAKFIYQSFYPNECFKKNECVMHVNKNCLDNRIKNLKKVTRKKSKQIDMLKSVRTIIATPKNLKKAFETNRDFYDNRIYKECSKCFKIDLVDNFPKGRSKCQKCINNYNIERRKNYKYSNSKKKCNRCGYIKLDKEFPKLDNTCKKCRNKVLNKYKAEQKENLGDWYVKQYGKYTYGYKEFNQKLIDELRKELKEKRKPKHIFEGKNFRTTKDFANYIFKKYKVPITTVKKRIYKGKTEYECTLNRKEFTKYNLKKN